MPNRSILALFVPAFLLTFVVTAFGQSTTQPSTMPNRNRPSTTIAKPRGDANAMLAHQQLVEKAKAGRIDLYFLGDSITRRWGTTDPVWAELLADWNKRFFGWNAANFGWGGDQIQNILWRVENGELDGVNPKVIVLLAGTNNVGDKPGSPAKVPNIVAGIRHLTEVCRAKAPNATIVLMAIFPRNDNMAVLPEINAINQQIETFADGKRVLFLNLNDKLADKDGKLFDGIANDKLHLTLKGYQAWGEGLEPVLTKLLGPPAKEDHAPPHTGDPSAAKPARGS